MNGPVCLVNLVLLYPPHTLPLRLLRRSQLICDVPSPFQPYVKTLEMVSMDGFHSFVLFLNLRARLIRFVRRSFNGALKKSIFSKQSALNKIKHLSADPSFRSLQRCLGSVCT